ncbi:MAG: hypothetical protein M3O02_11200 [Acidobacteriota bacterium]|nr:hypothetical protein [Acidobacteriota bacterium]
MAIQMPKVFGHPNRLPFDGCLTLIDVPSDKSPGGARGHRVILTRGAAEAALPGLLGMAISYKDNWSGHDSRQKCGIITGARIDRDRLLVNGFAYAKDFPELARRAAAQDLGMSYELADAHVNDMRAAVWTLTRATFTGAAVLLRTKAAYGKTNFRMAPATSHRMALCAGITGVCNDI